jgi:hypothetical protein
MWSGAGGCFGRARALPPFVLSSRACFSKRARSVRSIAADVGAPLRGGRGVSPEDTADNVTTGQDVVVIIPLSKRGVSP